MNKPLVTILTPCYNGEKYIARFINSVIEQSYRPIQFILVNDGSNDKTDRIVKKYITKLKEAKIEFEYVVQTNQGQATAINNGLKKVKGVYLTWPDSDDILPKESISEKVFFLERNTKYGFVRTDAYYYNESDLTKPFRKLERKNPRRADEKIFERLLLEQNMYSIPGTYMVRMSAIDEVIKDRNIYCSRGGQNWQLQLPISYKFLGGYIDKPLYYYIVRKNSHSRQVDANDMKKQWERYDICKDIIVNTVSRINNFDHNKYDSMINEKYIRYKFIWSANHNQFDECEKYYEELKKNKTLRTSDKLRFKFKKSSIIKKVITTINKCLFYIGIYNF